jgi:xylitol oxidase
MRANWAGTIQFAATEIVAPTSVEQVQEVVERSAKVRALGTGHSFSTVADTDRTLLLTESLPPLIEVDRDAALVRVGAGVRWGDLAAAVAASGLALHNMGSLPHISVAGSVATGTHGSGSRLGCLATAVSAQTMVTATGELRTLSRGDADFAGSVVALGLLGIVVDLTLDLVPGYDVAQTVWRDVPYPVMFDEVLRVLDIARSVSAFTTWGDHGFEQVWAKSEAPAPARADLSWTGGRVADAPLHPIPGMDASSCTDQLSVVGPWWSRIPHFRSEFTPSSGVEIQTEYVVAREHATAALRALHATRADFRDVLQVSEIRSIASDDLWLSPAYSREGVALHFTWLRDAEPVAAAVRMVEEALAPFDPRPHWGKVFSLPPERVLRSLPMSEAFADLRREWDPAGCFTNDFTESFFPA